MDAAAPALNDFVARARARLTLDVPAALTDPTAQSPRGDLDLDPAMWERVGVSATKPAAVSPPASTAVSPVASTAPARAS